MAAKMTHHTTKKAAPKLTTLREMNAAEDTRERKVTDVRLWNPKTNQLAYGPGMAVPVDEIDSLVPDEEWQKRTTDA